MAVPFNTPITTLVLLIIFLSTLEICSSRFVWDFGSYCLNKCAKARHKSTPVSVCSCQWISSNYRRSLLNTTLNKYSN
ncbi:unnamed protein product [Adineta ricciae]|uniref:Uncharacterized protein n=1 Tax=Adineta ricciae TaxID=249248 RepID=A0A816F0M4_ADIRI|nr:unnamed protein product [Adineta ricciae]